MKLLSFILADIILYFILINKLIFIKLQNNDELLKINKETGNHFRSTILAKRNENVGPKENTHLTSEG